jgi:hypothetical protein
MGGHVLLLESDPRRRVELAAGLRAASMCVEAVEGIAEISQWPQGDVVVTEAARYTPWWKTVGARHVVVLADTPEQGVDACARGATVWLPRQCSAAALVFILKLLSLWQSPTVPPDSRAHEA